MRPSIPAAMVARSGRLPRGEGWSYEVKWDGFRAIVCTHDGLRVRSRRGRNMAALLPELAGLPDGLMLDGELVAWEDGLPNFPRLCARMLHGERDVSITYLAFDVLYVDRESAMVLPYAERRHLLEELDLSGPAWHTPSVFDDGNALYEVVCVRGLEGVVAKRLSSAYRSDGRGWVKTKNETYWRLEEERESWQRELPSAAHAGGLRTEGG
jgi:bifunctional non-homologous end joining protein LigD